VDTSVRLPCGGSYKALGTLGPLWLGGAITVVAGLRSPTSYLAMWVTAVVVILNLALTSVRFDPSTSRVRIVWCGVRVWMSKGPIGPDSIAVATSGQVLGVGQPFPQVTFRSSTFAQKDRRLWPELTAAFTGRTAADLEADIRRIVATHPTPPST